jgi:hypothetical protein
MSAVDVRPATRADIGELSRVLARAFYEDPVTRWECPTTKYDGPNFTTCGQR